jgi:hypothetical protein
MKKIISAVLLTLIISLMLTTFVSFANATTPETVSGTWKHGTPATTVYEKTQAGQSDNRFWDLSVNSIWTGDIAGTQTSDSKWVLHYPLGGSGTINAHGSNIITATVDGKSGSLYVNIEGKKNVDGSMDGTWVIIGGTGDLTNLHGQGTFSGVFGGDYSYTGQIHWEGPD